VAERVRIQEIGHGEGRQLARIGPLAAGRRSLMRYQDTNGQSRNTPEPWIGLPEIDPGSSEFGPNLFIMLP
jgi:hypothetical protein